ncbi:MAG: alpha/beta hydrolase [Candidatus Binataceae bacterium]
MNLIHAAYEPAGDGPHPAMIAFHGWGANAMDLLGLAPYVADGRFLVVCPQGPMEVPIGAIRGYGWFPMQMGRQPDEAEIDRAAENASKFIDEALKCYPIDRRKLVIAGFSQGGGMAYRLALSNPERFAALVAMSTWFPPGLAERVTNRDALAMLPTLVQHGRADDMIEIARARQSIETLRELKVPVQYREYDCGHEITAEGLQDLSKFLLEKVVSPILRA